MKIMVQTDREYRINEKINKEKYLKYFPVDGNKENPAAEKGKEKEEKKEEKKVDKKACIYCGSINVPQYGQEPYEACEDCRAELLGDKQQFEDILWQTQKDLKLLMDISVDLNMGIIYKKNWLQQSKRYFKRSKEKRDNFGKDFVGVRTEGKTITFIVHGILPRSTYMYLISGYMIGSFLEKKIPKLSEYEVYRPIKYAMMKWGSLHYMYLNGYRNFCRWKDLEESKDIEYKELKEKIGIPLENNGKDMVEIIDILKEKITESEKGEGKEETEKTQETQHSAD